MEKSPRPAQLEAAIREISRELLELTITPHVRELRAKAVTYGRVIGNWAVYAPSAPQLEAMVECIAELEAKVVEAKRDGNRDVSKVTRRRTGADPSRSNSGSSLLPSAIPPSMGWSSSPPPDSSGGRARRSSQPLPTKRDSASEAPTRPPPAISGSPPAATKPPVSAPRPIEGDHPTPVPALLRSRRSH